MNESFSHLLKPLGMAFRTAVAARNQLYDRGWFEVKDCGAPVVSVGNLTTGGTGKTPFTLLLAQSLREKNRRVAIVSRGYKAQLENSVSRVDVSNLRLASEKFGDEPTMLAHKLGNIPVFVGAEKFAVASRAVEEVSPEVVIADDAFQHRKLKRAFDIVLLDATEPWWHFRPLPSGRMREPFSALLRADAVILSKANLSDPVRLERIRDQARAAVDSSRMPVFVDVDYRVTRFMPLRSFHASIEEYIPADRLRGEKIFVLSAIGRPEAFRDLVRRETGAEVIGHRSYADHHFFSKSEIANIEATVKKSGATKILVTEKDAVKFSADDFTIEPLVSQLEAVPGQTWDEFHARLAGSLI